MKPDDLSSDTKQRISDAVEQFHQAAKPELQDVQSRGGNRGNGYRIIFSGFDGCSRAHSWDNLRAAGIPVQYINVNIDHRPVRDRPPFAEIPTRDANEAFRLADRYGLGPNASMVAIVGPNNRTVATLNSQSPQFARQVEQILSGGRGQQAQGGRGH